MVEPADEALHAQRPASLSRASLFTWLFLLLGLNSLAGQAVRAIIEQGFPRAFAGLFGVSAIVWTALVAGISIMRGDRTDDRPRRWDWMVGLVAIGAALLPFDPASMVALSILSAYAIATSRSGSPLRRAALIFLTLTATLIWGRLLLATFSRPVLDVDALFVASLLGAERQGNMIWFEGERLRLIIAPGCSSIQGLSLSLLLWTTINAFFQVPLGWKAAAWCGAVLATTVAVNVLRIGAMLAFPDHFDAIHTGWGYQLSMWATLFIVGAVSIYGARDAIFVRR